MPTPHYNLYILFRRTLMVCFLACMVVWMPGCNQNTSSEGDGGSTGTDSVVYVVPNESTAVGIWPPVPTGDGEVMAETTDASAASIGEPLASELDKVGTTSGQSPVSEPSAVATASAVTELAAETTSVGAVTELAAETTSVGEGSEAIFITRADNVGADSASVDTLSVRADTTSASMDTMSAGRDTLVFFNIVTDTLISDTTRTDSLIIDSVRIDTLVFAVARVDTLTIDSTSVVVVELRQPVVALRTNLLYDAALVPNIGLEIWLGKQFTIAADWFGTWLSWDERHLYWQGYGGYLTLRYYFGKQAKEYRFVGHHAGIYGSALTYDVEFGGKGYQAAKFGFGGGVEYGYSLRLNRSLSFDFTLGVGYQGGEYKVYQPTNDGTGHYEWLATYKRNWIGPTKAEISLKWLIAPVDKKKGGAQ